MNTPNTPPNDHTLLAPDTGAGQTYTEKTPLDARRPSRTKWILAGAGVFIVALIVIIVPVYFTVIKPKNTASQSNIAAPTDSSGNNTTPETTPPKTNSLTTGGDGSIVVTANGNFTYKNPFGGFWVYDPNDPFNNGAKAQSWTPALNETWKWGRDTVKGVNVGGWFVLEPFISPALFEKYLSSPTQAVDEYSLSQLMRADGSINDLEKHYQTFITEEDFAQIAGAGLNWVRLPIPFWAVQTFEEEPYYAKVSWKYIVQAMQWARKYGLRINLDLHSHPGSQNGWNHSGYGRGVDAINWLKGLMGIANAQRSLDHIRIITEFISQPQYAPLVPMFGIVNEPFAAQLDRRALEAFNYQAYKMIRGITGIGEGKGPIISIHDGFASASSWYGFLAGADRVALDTHPYFAFAGANNAPLTSYIAQPCNTWGPDTNTTQQQFGIYTAGEFSAAINDCGLFVNGIPETRAYGGNCAQWDNWQAWDQTTKDNLKAFMLTSMESLQNWFFWTWKIGNSTTTGTVSAPFWSYQLGLANGWMPTDPREAIGKCRSIGAGSDVPFNGVYQPWQTGGDPAAQPTATATYAVWPPATLGNINVASYLPTYTPTAPIATLSGPAVPTGVDGGNGWYDKSDTTGMMTKVADCNYPDAYAAATLAAPDGPLCGPGAVAVPTGRANTVTAVATIDDPRATAATTAATTAVIPIPTADTATATAL
jgi:aryl-phospho-beta-D-glucosidase BglC (GH1 family)